MLSIDHDQGPVEAKLAADSGEKVAQVLRSGDFEREWRRLRLRQAGQRERFELIVGLSAEAIRAVFRLDVSGKWKKLK